jgi:hypothetical protein
MRSSFHLRQVPLALLLGVSAIAVTGCTSGSDGGGSQACETGEERCDCYRNESCDKGLMCVSDVCVKDPAASDEEDASGGPSDKADGRAADPENDNTDPDETNDEQTSNEQTNDEDPDETEAEETEPEQTDPQEEDPTTTDEDATDAVTSQASDDSDETDPGVAPDPVPQQQELNDGTVGSACGTCDGELVCADDIPGGYCTATCYTHEECGPKGVCLDYVCYRSCDIDEDCRPNYLCMEALDLHVCDFARSEGTCANTCRHYLDCKAIADEEVQQTCEANCANAGYLPEDLAAFQATDCATAIYMVEGPSSGEGGGGADCDGCQWDGESCVYLSQYTLVSTAGFTCDASCCN